METIEINKVTLRAFHGVDPQERKVGNIFEVTVHLHGDFSIAMTSDDVADTINYAEVVDIIKREMEVPSMLLENVAGRIRRALTGRYHAVTAGMVKVTKITPPITGQMESVAVVTRW